MNDKGGPLDKDARVVEDEEAAILEQMRQCTVRRRQERIHREFDMDLNNWAELLEEDDLDKEARETRFRMAAVGLLE